MCRSIKGVNGRTGKLLDWVQWISQVLIVPLIALALWGWWNHEQRLNLVTLNQEVMANNRFTSADGLAVWKEIAVIRAQLDHKADAIGATPVREDIKEIKAKLDKLTELILAHISSHK